MPAGARRFGGDFMLTSQGDQEIVFAARLGAPAQQLRVLELGQSVDDTAFATTRRGALVTTDSTADAVVVVTGPFAAGAAYTAATPGGANSAPPHPAPNFLATIDLQTGAVRPVAVRGVALQPKGLIFLPR